MRARRLISVLNTLTLRGLGSGVAVLFTVLVARYLENEAAAHFFLLFNITMIAAVCFRWGLDEVVIRRVASAAPAEVPILARQLVGLSHQRVLVWAVFAVTATLALLHPVVRSALYGLQTAETLIAMGASALIALVACAARVHQGVGQTNLAAFILNILTPLLSLLGLLVLIVSGVNVNAFDLIILYAGAAIAGYLGVVSLRYGSPLSILIASRDTNTQDLLPDTRAANKLGGVVLAQQALSWGALLIIPLTYGDAVYKGFVVTQKVATLISLVMLAVNFTFSSRFAALHATGQSVELRRMVKFSIIAILAASTLASVIVVLFRDLVFNFARIEANMSGVLIVLLISQVLLSLASLYSVVLSMCRDDNFLLATQGITNTSGLLLFLLLSQTSNLEVACIAFAASYFILLLVLGMRIRRITAA
ncbi:hypothetical protein D3C78_680030 [compost metagenome]